MRIAAFLVLMCLVILPERAFALSTQHVLQEQAAYRNGEGLSRIQQAHILAAYRVRTIDPRFPLDRAAFAYIDCDDATYNVAFCDRERISNEVTCVAQGIYFEARGEVLEGKLAVAKAILNRVASKRYPNTACAVVYQGSTGRGCQFSWACKGFPPDPKNRKAWDESVEIATDIMTDPTIAPFGTDVLNFHAVYVNPRWGMRRVGRYGLHLFYAPR